MTFDQPQFQLLGSFQVRHADRSIQVGGPIAQAVLVALLYPEPDTRVLPDQIVNKVWGPAAATRATDVYQYISKLRKALAPTGLTIRGHRPGYQVTVARDAVDAAHFHDMVAAARRLRDSDPTDAIRRLRTALNLWRGSAALDNLTLPGARLLARELDDARLDAEEDLAALELAHGDPQHVIRRVRPITATNLGRGGLVAVLIRALHADGQGREALRVFDRYARYADAHGLTPYRQVCEAKDDIQHHRRPATGRVRPTPFQLPPASRHFTGRDSELTRLADLWPADGSTPHTGLVAVISGMAGVGKTSLAVHAAHSMAHKFPGGVLFQDMHGFAEDAERITPGAAMDALLRSLAVPADQIPGDLGERTARYRSALAGRRMLIVLDNAADETQIRPLLPGAPGCLVLVTSRRRLTRLDDAHPVNLDPPDRDDAVTLFRAYAGDRAGTDQQVIERIVELCGNLPHTLQISAARLRVSRSMTPTGLLTLLHEKKKEYRLADVNDGERSVAPALPVSYRHLTATQQHAFRLLGLAPGPDIDKFAAAALIGRSVERACVVLDELAEVSLLQPGQIEGRYAFHDLTRDYAARLARPDREVVGRGVLTRLFDYYRQAVRDAMRLCYPNEAAGRIEIGETGAMLPEFDGPASAEEWLDSELPNLLAVAAHAARHGWPAHACHLSLLLGDVQMRMGRYSDALGHYRQALELARTEADQVAECHILLGMGTAYRAHGDHRDAVGCFLAALRNARARHDRSGECRALRSLGDVWLTTSRYQRATEHYQASLALAEELARSGEQVLAGHLLTHVSMNLGKARLILGDHAQADRYCRRALHLVQGRDDRSDEGYAAAALGLVHLARGDHAPAAECFERALDIARSRRDNFGEASALAGLGRALLLAGDHQGAGGRFGKALDVAQRFGLRNGVFEALLGLGELSAETGDTAGALVHQRRAFDVAHELDQPHDQARALDALSRSHENLGHLDQAGEYGTRAWRIFAELGTPEADRLRVRLVDLGFMPTPPDHPSA